MGSLPSRCLTVSVVRERPVTGAFCIVDSSFVSPVDGSFDMELPGSAVSGVSARETTGAMITQHNDTLRNTVRALLYWVFILFLLRVAPPRPFQYPIELTY